MTDEEKYIAWRNANSIIDRHNVTDTSIGHKHIHWNNGVDRHKAYLDGLADGRKEVTYMKAEEYDKYLDACRKNIQLEEDNAELKAHCKAVDKVNEKMKCCGNCDNVHYEWGEKVIEGVCRDCRNYNKWKLAE